MELIFLGTGTSHGVPMIGCHCGVCRSADPRNQRGRSSVHVVMDGLHVQVDAAPEFRLQCVREDLGRIDHFILTHEHADHMAGMDDLRRFCDFKGGEAMDVFSTPAGLQRMRDVFPYAIMDKPVSRSYVAFRLHQMPERLELPQGVIESTLLPHGRVQTLGLVFTERSSGRKLAYFTDCKTVTARGVELARGADLVVLDGLRPQDHPTHMTISEAVAMAALIGAPSNYLTHLTHHVDHGPIEASLPEGVRLAYDGLRVRL
jgi:phosphoribosyl 1,2-cyclic phosphate phosphodiesterase